MFSINFFIGSPLKLRLDLGEGLVLHLVRVDFFLGRSCTHKPKNSSYFKTAVTSLGAEPSGRHPAALAEGKPDRPPRNSAVNWPLPL